MAQIDRFFDVLIDKKGSDLHLGTGVPPLVRIRGELSPIRDTPVTPDEMESLLFEILDERQHDIITNDLDLDFAYAYERKARFRANYFYKHTGLGAVFRMIPSKVLSLNDLRSPEAVRKLADRRAGLILVTGPTGSGKSTTLAAMLNHINATRACHILTIEDPIEFVHDPIRSQVTHREVGSHASTFTAAIRSSGRENPDVILIGELRTNETMKLALQLASYGILVFGTVHTNSAAATCDRIINAFPADEQPQVRGLLAESLVGVVSQQLIKTADGRGRVAAQEILIGSPATAAIIREGKTYMLPNVIQAGKAVGMLSMDACLEKFVRDKLITWEAAIEKAEDKEGLQRVLAMDALAPPIASPAFAGTGGA